jgi:tetratricopeptide (TPR) repeat protein
LDEASDRHAAQCGKPFRPGGSILHYDHRVENTRQRAFLVAERAAPRQLAGVLLIAAVCVGIYANTLRSPFVFDDINNILENRAIRIQELGFEPLSDLLFATRVTEHVALDPDGPSPAQRPVAFLSFALNYRFGRYEVVGFHAVNILVHFVNGVFVYLLVLALLGQLSRLPSQRDPCNLGPSPRQVALVASLLFVAHPVQTESVTYVIQRMTSLATSFYLAALLLYIGGRRGRTASRRAGLLCCAVALWLLALGTKQNAATLPLVVLLTEWFFFQDLNAAWLRRHRIPLAALALAAGLAAAAYLSTHSAALSYANRDFSMGERVLTQFRVVIFYITLLIFPVPSRLNLCHDFATSHSLLDPPSTLAALVALVGLLVLAAWLAPRQRLICFCVFWFFGNLALESSVISLEMVFEHRLYLPLVGAALLAAYGLALLFGRHRAVFLALAGLWIACLAAGAFARNETWSDPVTLWSDVVSKSPRDARARNNLGDALIAQGRIAEAGRHLAAAVEIDPGYERAHHNLAQILEQQDRLDEAVDHYSEAVRLRPALVSARVDLGLALEKQGRLTEGARQISEAVRIRPNSARARYALGNLLGRNGDMEAALPHLVAAARLDPGHAMAHYDLGIARAALGQPDAAIESISAALRLDPTLAQAHAMLGNLYAQQGQIEAARRHLTEALRLAPDHAPARALLERLPPP